MSLRSPTGFFLYFVLLPHVVIYGAISLFHTTVWRTKGSKRYCPSSRLDWKTRFLSFAATRLLCLLLLSSLYLNLFFLLNLPSVWWWYLPYAFWCVFFSEKYGRPLGFNFSRVRESLLWRYVGEYFPLTLVKEHEDTPFPTDRNYLFGFHPHGIFALSFIGNFAGRSGRPENDVSRLLPGIDVHLSTLQVNMCMPFFRHIGQLMGFVACRKENILGILNSEKKGKAVGVVVGGAREALFARSGGNDLIIKRRRGVFELALRTGASLVPVYALGENDTYNIVSPDNKYLRAISEATMRIFGFAVPIFYGRGVLQHLMPLRVPVYTMIGDPIHCTRVEHPTEAATNELRERYCKALETLYEKLIKIYQPERPFDKLHFVD